MIALILGSAALLLVGLIVEAQPLWIVPVLLSAAWGIAGRYRGMGRVISLWLVAQVALAALSPVSPVAALGAVVLALAAWDLEAFGRLTELSEQASQLERLHRRRLGAALAIGGGLGLFATAVQLRLEFAPALAVALAVLFTIGSLAGLAGRLRTTS